MPASGQWPVARCDGEGITHPAQWSRDVERAGQIDWRDACESLSAIIEPGMAFERLRADAELLRALPDLLRAEGLPELTMNHPQIALKNLDQRLREWGLK